MEDPKEQEKREEPGQQQPAAGEPAATEPAQAAAEDVQALRKGLEEQRARAEQYLANWKRAQADLENYRKRVEQEKQETGTFANAMLVSSLLPILDDLERAFDTLSSDLAGLTWVDGLKLIYRKLLSNLESQGLSVIETDGQRFDPRYHEAILHVPGEEGRVMGELQKGYLFKDRVLRPALVKVGNGESSEAAEPRADERAGPA